MRALWSKYKLHSCFSKTFLRFLKMDKNKCPKFKSQQTLWKNTSNLNNFYLNLLKETLNILQKKDFC